MPGIAVNRTGVARALGDEERLHELLDVDAMLADERAHDLAAAQTPRT